MTRVLVWYSDGAASAVAAQLAVQQYGAAAEVLKCDTTASEHPDNVRFRRDVERWIGRRVILLRSEKYADVDAVFERTRYMAGVGGARCTAELKKLVRQQYERPGDVHVFGYTADEQHRINNFTENNPDLTCAWVLADRGITKRMCYHVLEDAGIALPEMYGLGFAHNNCLGCVKATSPAYWNRVRRLFPAVFERRAQQSRALNVRLVRVDGQMMFLDELPRVLTLLDQVADDGEIECGPFCEVP